MDIKKGVRSVLYKYSLFQIGWKRRARGVFFGPDFLKI